MTITQKEAETALQEITLEGEFSFKGWHNKKFETLKHASTTEKGNIGEDFLARMLEYAGCEGVEVLSGRRGEYDVKFSCGNREVKFEMKVATMDVNGAFQFNGVRLDQKYTHLFCLGISPDSIGFLIVPKEKLVTEPDKFKLVAMAKDTNSTFKLTRKKEMLCSFDEFEEQVLEIML